LLVIIEWWIFNVFKDFNSKPWWCCLKSSKGLQGVEY
jgi:hypothetical protein